MVSEGIMRKKTKEIFSDLEVEVDPSAIMRTLPVSKRQMVEIAKAVSYHSKIIVFDEPTSSLTAVSYTHLDVYKRQLKYSALASLFSSVKLSGSGYVYLIDGDGVLIYHPERSLIASGLVTEGNQTAAAYRDGIYTQTWNGEKRSIIVRGVGYTGWKVVGVVDQPGFTMGSSQDLLFVLVIFCAYFELLIFMNVLLSKKLTDPIQKLKESVGRVEEGGESLPIYVGGTSETRELGTAVQGMVDRMRQLTEDMVREHEQKHKSELNALQAPVSYTHLDVYKRQMQSGDWTVLTEFLSQMKRIWDMEKSSPIEDGQDGKPEFNFGALNWSVDGCGMDMGLLCTFGGLYPAWQTSKDKGDGETDTLFGGCLLYTSRCV